MEVIKMYTYEVYQWIENGKSVKIVGRNKKEAKRKAEKFIEQNIGFDILTHYQGDGNK
jgi:hypothetical protein